LRLTAPTSLGKRRSSFVEVEDFLSQRLGLKVDLVMKRALKPRLGQRILAEALTV
jgi:hypothetical protein